MKYYDDSDRGNPKIRKSVVFEICSMHRPVWSTCHGDEAAFTSSERSACIKYIPVQSLIRLNKTCRRVGAPQRAFNPRTDGGADIRPPPWGFSWIAEKPRRVAPRNFAWLFIYQFCVLCVSGDLLPSKVRSPGYLEWLDVKSLFCIFIAAPEPQLMTKHFETRWIV